MANIKATKKFEQRHLKEVLKQRGSVLKIKKSKQRLEKKRARAHRDGSPQADDDDQPSAANGRKHPVDDDFFQTGFELPERVKSKRKAALSSSASKAKKLKVDNDGADSDSSESSVPEEQRTGGVVDAADGFGEDDAADDDVAHKTQLEALKNKDPEFYKYLEENDEELLQFEDDDLAAIDLLSDDDASTSKPAKSEGKERAVDAAMIERWRTALAEARSLRSTRELVLAFRAAVHASEESETKFRYSIPSPESKLPLA
jgi:nucleolar complex protein 2